MKFLFEVLLVLSVLQVAINQAIFSKHDMWWSKKYSDIREPPIEKFNKFNAFDDPEVVEEKWIEQRLNNFDPLDNRTFMMRYNENMNHFQDGGPIFIFIGGEWTIDKDTLRFGHMYDMARDLNGIMYYTEHRYYGRTHPTPDLTNENLRFLNIDQALADLAHFIVDRKASVPGLRDSGVILVGGSYSATMATWFMQKYPHLANGAWSSSAPLEAKVDFVEYMEVVTDAVTRLGGDRCAQRISSAMNTLEQLVEDGNTALIEEYFRLCYPLKPEDTLDLWSFFSSVGGSFAGIVQYHREYYQTIQSQCELIDKNGYEDDLQAFAHWWVYGDEDPAYVEDFCFDHHYDLTVYWLSGTQWEDYAAWSSWKQWYFQTCAEYGWYQSSGSEEIIFGSNFPVDLSLQLCKDLYDNVFSNESVHQNVYRTNVIYGSLSPNVRNVYSTHGEFDPWRPMGVQVDINESSPTVILPNESHCSDLSSKSSLDTPEMTASKERITELVHQWLGLSSTVPEVE